MNQSILSAFPFFKSSTQKRPQLHTATLLSPGEVDVAFKDEPAGTRELVLGHWMLAGAVNQEMFSALRLDAGREIAGELGIVTTPAGAAYLIMCSELKGRHHRHVLPLYDAKVADFLRHAAREPFRLFIESVHDGRERMLYTSPLEPELFVASRDMCQQMDRTKHANFVDELPLLIAHVAKLNMMRRLKDEPIREVDVSVLLPSEATAGHLPRVSVSDSGSGYCH